ncbi:MAG: ribosome biogenesis GTPase Der [Acidimicrobiia bacterium]|nr:ribosome biogenesis GTPase Der [Acidimicrobiia bacterium]
MADVIDPNDPVVVIAGRPNVGKSTLMNRIIGRREAIVEERPGVTRDRKSVSADWLGRTFTLVDTGGWVAADDAHLDGKVSRQSEQAVDQADVVLFVVDGTVGVTEDDMRVAQLLRRTDVPVLLVANKMDDAGHEAGMWELLSLGMGEPHPVSSLHGRGTGDLLDAVIGHLAERSGERTPSDADGGDERALSIAIVGRPNVGKSTLFNQLVGTDRAVVHDLPGTTRDSVDTMIESPLGRIRLVDTAGMRRKSRIDEATEYYSLVRALESVDRADIALLVIDATEGITHQDQRLAERVDAAGCPVAVVFNKWELLDGEQRADIDSQLDRKLHFLSKSPVLKISALTGKGVQKLLPALEESIGEYHSRIPTRDVNRVIRNAQSRHAAPDGARVLYAVQGAAEPPTFTLFANRALPRTYIRFLERSLREAFDLGTTPVKMRVRKRDD